MDSSPDAELKQLWTKQNHRSTELFGLAVVKQVLLENPKTERFNLKQHMAGRTRGHSCCFHSFLGFVSSCEPNDEVDVEMTFG